MMFAGFIAPRLSRGALRVSDAGVIRSVVANITGPAFVFASIYGKEINTQMVIAPIVHFASLVMVLVLAYLAARILKLDRPTTGGLMLAAAFGNTGFLGYPLATAAFPNSPQALPTAVMVDQLGMTVPLYSLGIAIAVMFGAKDSSRSHMLGFLKTPLFISMILVFAMRLPGLKEIHIPSFILGSGLPDGMGVINYLSDATIPLAMISLGMSIGRMQIRPIIWPFIAAVSLKFVAMPLFSLIGLRFAGITGTVFNVSMMESIMPTAIMASVIAGRYGSNGEFVSAATFVMMLLSIGIIPLFLHLIH